MLFSRSLPSFILIPVYSFTVFPLFFSLSQIFEDSESPPQSFESIDPDPDIFPNGIYFD